MVLFRRRHNETFERDVLRHDVILFEVEPLTDAYSFGDVFEPDEYFFEDGLTRRSAKRSQAVQPPLERRGALSECRATPLIQIGTGFKLRVPNSSARAGFSVSTVRRSIMLVRDTNFFKRRKVSPAF